MSPCLGGGSGVQESRNRRSKVNILIGPIGDQRHSVNPDRTGSRRITSPQPAAS